MHGQCLIVAFNLLRMTTRKQSHLQERNHPPNRQAATATKRKKAKKKEETTRRKRIKIKIKEKQAISQLISSLSWRVWELDDMDSCLFCKRLTLTLKERTCGKHTWNKKSACIQCNNFSVIIWLVVWPVRWCSCSWWLLRAFYALNIPSFREKADIKNVPTFFFSFCIYWTFIYSINKVFLNT